MDLYRRLTRCSDLDMLQMLEQDMQDAFGEPPRQAIVFFALTELRLLAQMFGINSIIRKPPDVVMTVSDAQKAQAALTGAPGTLRVIDEKTVYLRMPASFMEPEPCLMVLRNLMRQAYDRQKNAPAPETAPAHPAAAVSAPAARHAEPKQVVVAAEKKAPEKSPAAAKSRTVQSDLAKLASLRDQGILTAEEFENARKRLLASA
jgi:hypothetical protein